MPTADQHAWTEDFFGVQLSPLAASAPQAADAASQGQAGGAAADSSNPPEPPPGTPVDPSTIPQTPPGDPVAPPGTPVDPAIPQPTPGDPVPPPGTPVDPYIPQPPPGGPGAATPVHTQVTIVNQSAATFIYVQASDTQPPFQPPARYETKAPYTLQAGRQVDIVVTNVDAAGTAQPAATSGCVAYFVLDDPNNTEVNFGWYRDYESTTQTGTYGTTTGAPFDIKADFSTLDQIKFTVSGKGAPPPPPAADFSVPRDYAADCAPQAGGMPHAPKNIFLCAKHQHVLDDGKKKIIANSLTEYYRNHPNEATTKTPAPDCTPKPNAVDGPKNHVLCAKHGHVYDSYTGDVIAESLQAYDAARPVPRPMEADCRPVNGQLPAAPAEIKLCATHGHVLDTKKGTIEGNTRTMYYRAHPEYAPKAAAPTDTGGNGDAQAELLALVGQLTALLAPVAQFLNTLGALPCAGEIQNVLATANGLLAAAQSAKDIPQDTVAGVLPDILARYQNVRGLAKTLDGALADLRSCAERNAASEAIDWLKSLVGTLGGIDGGIGKALKKLQAGV